MIPLEILQGKITLYHELIEITIREGFNGWQFQVKGLVVKIDKVREEREELKNGPKISS